MTDFQSEQLDNDRSGDRTCDLNHRSMLTIPLRHRSLIDSYVIDSIPNFAISIPLNFNNVSPAFIAKWCNPKQELSWPLRSNQANNFWCANGLLNKDSIYKLYMKYPPLKNVKTLNFNTISNPIQHTNKYTSKQQLSYLKSHKENKKLLKNKYILTYLVYWIKKEIDWIIWFMKKLFPQSSFKGLFIKVHFCLQRLKLRKFLIYSWNFHPKFLQFYFLLAQL